MFTLIVEIGEILFDAAFPVKQDMANLAAITGWQFLRDAAPLGIGALSVANVVVPMIFMIVPIVVLCLLIKWIYQPDGIRDYMFALFTGFVVSYALLTVVGSFFRGEGMLLMWPWDPRMARLD